MDRSILSVRSGPKPRFQVNEKAWELLGMPIPTNHHQFFSENPPEIVSYLYRLLSRRLDSPPFKRNHDVTMCYPERHQIKLQVNQYLIPEFIREVQKRGSPYVFLIFHPQNEVSRNDEDWRDQLLHQIFATEHVPYISSKTVIREHAHDKGNDSLTEYYIQNDGHPTTLQNLLIAEEIKKFVLNVGG